MTTVAEVRSRRRAQRRALLDEARAFTALLDPDLRVRAVCVFGSVARGDHHRYSDVDVLVVADGLPGDVLARGRALPRVPPRVAPLAWTVEDWTKALRRRNPIAVECVSAGVWLLGGPDDLAEEGGRPPPRCAQE